MTICSVHRVSSCVCLMSHFNRCSRNCNYCWSVMPGHVDWACTTIKQRRSSCEWSNLCFFNFLLLLCVPHPLRPRPHQQQLSQLLIWLFCFASDWTVYSAIKTQPIKGNGVCCQILTGGGGGCSSREIGYKSLWCRPGVWRPRFLRWRTGGEWVHQETAPKTLMIHEMLLLIVWRACGRVCVVLLLQGGSWRFFSSTPYVWFVQSLIVA